MVAMKVQRIGSVAALRAARIAFNKALGMKAMSPELTASVKELLKDVEQALRAMGRS